MYSKPMKLAVGAVVALYSMVGVGAADLAVSWWTIDGGGKTSTAGGTFELSGTIGQPDAGLIMAGGGFELTGGFWAVGPPGPAIPGDCNGDGDVDMDDFDVFAGCLGGPHGGLETECVCCDLDGDEDVDLTDFAELQRAFTGQSP